MNGLVRLLLLSFFVVSVAACGPAQTAAEAQFCRDVATLQTAVRGLRNLPETASLKEMNVANETLQFAWTNVRASGRNVDQANLGAVERAILNLQIQVEAAPNKASNVEAIASVQRAADGVRNALSQLRASANCR